MHYNYMHRQKHLYSYTYTGLHTVTPIDIHICMPTEICRDPSAIHDCVTGQVLTEGDATEPFEISNGVKQGCVLAPVIFNIFFTCMLAHSVQDLESGVHIRYHLGGSLFDLCHLTVKTKFLIDLIQEALFTNDCALVLLLLPRLI